MEGNHPYISSGTWSLIGVKTPKPITSEASMRTNEIGQATAEKMKTARLVVWAQHGIYGAGKDLDETFGLIETAEKAAGRDDYLM